MEFIGHQKQRQFLKQMVKSKRIPHALLFSGQEKLGKKTLGIEFIKWLFRDDIQKREHPDFILLQPERKNYKLSSFTASIQISHIRNLSWRLSLKPYSAPLKAGIVDQAHLMNVEAQNCFLKTLEEPKGKTILILITEYPHRLFPTILSRCQIIKFYPVKKEEIESYLKEQGIGAEKVKTISQISQGRPGLAIDFLKDPQKLKERQKLIKELTTLVNSDLASRFQYIRAILKEADLKEVLKVWLSYFRTLLTKQLSKSDMDNLQQYSFSKLKNILQQIENTIFLISTTNVNPKLGLEILMLQL